MGCGNSSNARTVPPTQVTESNVNNQRTAPVSEPVRRVASASSSKRINRKSITSIGSHSSIHIGTSKIGNNHVKSPSVHSATADVNQNIIIVWADANIDQKKKLYHDSITKLQRLTSSIYTYRKSAECVSYVDSVTEKKIFLIVSDEMGEELIPLVYDKEQVDSIYIFSQTKKRSLPWVTKWSQKVKEILFTMEDVFEQIKVDSGLVGSLVPISIIRRMNVPESVANELNQSYMYTQLLKDILLEMKYDSTAKSKLVDDCRAKY
ncbi:unnamed protein product, partial [Adineta ricciae]